MPQPHVSFRPDSPIPLTRNIALRLRVLNTIALKVYSLHLDSLRGLNAMILRCIPCVGVRESVGNEAHSFISRLLHDDAWPDAQFRVQGPENKS